MSLDYFARLQGIERLAATVNAYRDHEPLIWSGAMRLYGESISDIVAARHGLDSDDFEDRARFLQALRDRALIDETEYGSLDQIRRFGNKILHEKGVEPTLGDLSDTWRAFQQLEGSRFWVQGSSVSSKAASAYSIEELASEILEAYGPKVGAFFKKGALPLAGLAIGAFLLNEYGKYLDSDEYKESQRKREEERKKEENRQKRIAAEQRKREAEQLARRKAANEKLQADITNLFKQNWPWLGLMIVGLFIMAIAI